LSDGLHRVLEDGRAAPVHDLATLFVWAALALPAASRWFKWE
jgi:ABC-2 type transport system permease protein